MNIKNGFLKIFWSISFYLCILLGVLGVMAVLLDRYMFEANLFTLFEVVQFVTLIIFAFIIRLYIYPYVFGGKLQNSKRNRHR